MKTWPIQAWVSGEGVRLEPGKTKGKFSVVVDAGASPGPRWVRLINDDGASKVHPLIISGIPETAEKEPNDGDAQAGEIGSLPIVVNGALGKGGDIDTFRVKLKAGQTFVAALDANERLGSPIDVVLQIAHDGFVAAQNHDDRGLDPRLAFTAPRDGDYVVRVFGFASDPNSSIRYHGSAECVYRLTLTTGPFVDHIVPQIVAAGKSGQVELCGWNIPAGTMAPFVAQAAPGVQALPLPAGYAGDALATVTDVAAVSEQEPNEPTKAQKLTAPCVVYGRIDKAGDRDAFQFAVKKGEAWRVRVRSKTLDSPLDPVAVVLLPDGKQIFRYDDAGRGDPDVDANFKITGDTNYTVVVDDLFGNGGERYAYALDVRPVEAEIGLTVEAGEFAAAAGKPLEIPVTIDRTGGMTGEIELRLEGLPKDFPEVKAVSAAKGDSAKKATLKLTAPKAFSGPIRIVGEVKSPSLVRRAAEFPLANIPRAKLADLWLTVTAAKK